MVGKDLQISTYDMVRERWKLLQKEGKVSWSACNGRKGSTYFYLWYSQRKVRIVAEQMKVGFTTRVLISFLKCFCIGRKGNVSKATYQLWRIIQNLSADFRKPNVLLILSFSCSICKGKVENVASIFGNILKKSLVFFSGKKMLQAFFGTILKKSLDFFSESEN